MEKLVKILEENKYAVSECVNMVYAWKTSRGDGCNIGTTVTIFKSLFDDKYKISQGYFEFYSSIDIKYHEKEKVILRQGNIDMAIERLKQYA